MAFIAIFTSTNKETMMSESSKTAIPEFIGNLSSGTAEAKLGLMISQVALGTHMYGGKKKGKVSLDLTFSQFGEPEHPQVLIEAKISQKTPTKRGSKAEDDTTESLFYVARGGKLSVLPPKENAIGQLGVELVTNG